MDNVDHDATPLNDADRKSSEFRCDSGGTGHGFRRHGSRLYRPPQPVVGEDGNLRCPSCDQELHEDDPPHWKCLSS